MVPLRKSVVMFLLQEKLTCEKKPESSLINLLDHSLHSLASITDHSTYFPCSSSVSHSALHRGPTLVSNNAFQMGVSCTHGAAVTAYGPDAPLWEITCLSQSFPPGTDSFLSALLCGSQSIWLEPSIRALGTKSLLLVQVPPHPQRHHGRVRGPAARPVCHGTDNPSTSWTVMPTPSTRPTDSKPSDFLARHIQICTRHLRSMHRLLSEHWLQCSFLGSQQGFCSY